MNMVSRVRNVPVGEIAAINPKGPGSGTLSQDDLVDFLPMSDLSEDGTMAISAQRPYSEVAKGYTAFRGGDVLLAKITPCFENNKIGLADVATDWAFGSTEFHVLRPGKDVDSRYLLHFLRQDAIRMAGEKRMTGSGGQRRVPRSFLEELPIPLPPLAEQKRIAAILDQADALRRLRRRALDRLNTLGQAIFQDMFGDPISNPNGWPQATFGTACQRVTVGIVVRPASYYRDDGVPAIRGTNIKDDGLDLSDLVWFSEDDNRTTLKKTRIWAGDLVIVRSGRPGLAAVVPASLDGANAIDVLIATPDRRKAAPRFLRDLLNSPAGKRAILSESRGQVQQHFNVKSLSNASIAMPPLEVQLEYEKRLDGQEKVGARLKAAHRSAESLFSSLQHRAFTGQL